MAIADPQSITINAIAISCPRVASPVPTAGKFTANDGNTSLTYSDQYGAKRTRRSVRLDVQKIAADPLISAQNIRYSSSVTLVVDLPITGYTVAELKLAVDGFLAYLSASSGAKITQLLGGEI
jgi:hypothetical protein